MTDERQSSDAEREADEERTGGAIGTVVGATIGPFGAALGTVVDDTTFALKLSMGGARSAAGSGPDGAAARAGDASGEPLAADATTIEIEDAEPVEADSDEGKSATDDGADPEATDGDPPSADSSEPAEEEE